jgi:hypothetical protein
VPGTGGVELTRYALTTGGGRVVIGEEMWVVYDYAWFLLLKETVPYDVQMLAVER